MTVAVGDTVLEGMPILHVRGTAAAPPLARLSDAVALGSDRTFEQDPKFALRLLVDVAIKALSPAINDPTTAVQALDQIEDLLLRLGRCDLDVGRVYDAAGHLRFEMPVPSWDDLVVLALDEIRFCGATSVQVMRRTRALLQDLADQVLPERLAALEYYLVTGRQRHPPRFRGRRRPARRPRTGPPGPWHGSRGTRRRQKRRLTPAIGPWTTPTPPQPRSPGTPPDSRRCCGTSSCG